MTSMWRRRAIANNYALTNLAPAVINAANKSLSRGGTETIVYSNATPGIYYIGVKSEDQQAAEYALLGVFSELPFGSTDDQGNQHLLGFPMPMAIPDGSPQSSQAALVMAIAVQPIKLHRVIVTNVVAHELMTDLANFAPLMELTKSSFFSSRISKSVWTHPGSVMDLIISSLISVKHAACCQHPAWSPQTNPLTIPLSPTSL